MRNLWLARCIAAAVSLAWPAVPAWTAEPAPVEVYGNLPGIEDMAISPSGEGLAVVGRISGSRQLAIFGAGRKLRTLAPIGDTKLRYIRWIGEEAVLAVMSSTENLGPEFLANKMEFFGAIVVPVEDGKTSMVFANRSHMARAIFGDYGVRLVNGKWIGHFGGVEFKPTADRLGYRFDHGRPALFSVDLLNNTPQRMAPPPSESYWRRWLIDGSGSVAAILDRNQVDGRWKIANQRGTVIASGVDPTGDVWFVSFGRDGSTLVYALEDDESGTTRWMEVSLAGGESQEILTGVDIDRTYVDPASGRMLGYLEGEDEGRAVPRPVLFDPAHQAVISKVFRAFPNLDLRVVEWTPSFSHVLVHTSGNGDSGSWYIVDMGKLRADHVGSDYPLVPPEAVGPISTVAYKAGDGLDLDGILTLPPGRAAKNLPLVLLPHGGPHAHDDPAFDWWAQAFASHGYAVFQPNFRGSTNRDDAFRRAGYGEWGRKMQSDISDGLAALAEQGIIDPKRACIVGASYGGYAALAGVTLQQGLYRCAVAVAPVSDLSDMYWTDYRESGSRKVVKQSLQESLGNPSTFAAVSPRRHAAKADAPILLIHGKDDTVVPFKQSSAMADALKSAGKPHELVTLKDEDHWLSRAATRKQMLETTMRFVLQHNPVD